MNLLSSSLILLQKKKIRRPNLKYISNTVSNPSVILVIKEQVPDLRLCLCWIYLNEKFHNRRNTFKYLTLSILDSPFLIIYSICVTLKFPCLHFDKKIRILQDLGLPESISPATLTKKPNPVRLFSKIVGNTWMVHKENIF